MRIASILCLVFVVSLTACNHHKNDPNGAVTGNPPCTGGFCPVPPPVSQVADPVLAAPLPDVSIPATPAPASDDDAIINAVLANGDSVDTTRSAASDRAIVFGDNFVGTPAELHECVNDAKKNVLNLVRFEKFDPKNIRLFLNDQCTKANYEKWTVWVLDGAKKGDRRAFFNSSHGAEDTDANGNTVDIIVTWDMIAKNQWDTTTEVSAEFWSTTLRTTACDYLALNDACHAGGDMRAALGIIAKSQHRMVRSIDGPAPVKARIQASIKKISERQQLESLTGTVIPACQASELSEESSGFGGAATECYWRARKSLPIEAKSGDIIREANRLLKENQFSQHMGLVGVNKPLWSAE